MAAGFDVSVAEIALEAWAECCACGYIVDEQRLPELLPTIRGHVPTGGPWHQSKDLGELFVSRSPREKPVFLQLLKARGGKVHFLYFWKAFGEVARMADPALDDGLTSELETVRDRILRRLEESRGRWATACRHAFSDMLDIQVLISEVHRAAAMSRSPRFWQTFTRLLDEHPNGELSLQELTSIFLSLLRFAPVWAEQDALAPSGSGAPKAAGAERLLRRGATAEAQLVQIHIYDVSREESIQKLNCVLAHEYSPVKFGGVFHAGVEVNGLEWSFGFSPAEAHPGVTCIQPKKHPQHHYRQTVVLKETEISPEGIAAIISNMVEEYPGYDYDLLRRNSVLGPMIYMEVEELLPLGRRFLQTPRCGRYPKLGAPPGAPRRHN